MTMRSDPARYMSSLGMIINPFRTRIRLRAQESYAKAARTIMSTIRMHPMFNGHDTRWKKGKALMKILFEVPHNRSMSDEEFMECQSFVIGTMDGSDWPTDNLQDQMSLRDLIKKSYIGTRELGYNMPWRVLKSKFDKDRHWPVFEERGGKCYMAFFYAGLRKTEWVEFTQDVVRRMCESE